jgi:hypothetical protein
MIFNLLYFIIIYNTLKNNSIDNIYKKKYLNYKNKYLNLIKNMTGGESKELWIEVIEFCKRKFMEKFGEKISSIPDFSLKKSSDKFELFNVDEKQQIIQCSNLFNFPHNFS